MRTCSHPGSGPEEREFCFADMVKQKSAEELVEKQSNKTNSVFTSFARVFGCSWHVLLNKALWFWQDLLGLERRLNASVLVFKRNVFKEGNAAGGTRPILGQVQKSESSASLI